MLQPLIFKAIKAELEEIEMARENLKDAPQELWKGVVAGMVGGLVASWAMNQVFTVWSKINKGKENHQPEPEQSSVRGAASDPATLKLAKKLSREFLHREIPDEKVQAAEAVMHYGFGTVMGAVYGGLSEYVPQTKAGFGSAYATVLFVGADEIAVPLAGLSGKPDEVPLSSHALGFTAHMVYGFTTELVRRGTRKLLAA